MSHVPGLRSPYAQVGRLVFFGRMLDKIRLHATGQLPLEYQNNVGDTNPVAHDGRCCRFLGVRHEAIRERVLQGGSDLEILAWAEARGTPRTDEDCYIWNQYMMKVGWRDERSAAIPGRVRDAGLEGRTIDTSFDFIEFDEGRNPIASRAWELRAPVIILLMGVAGSGKTTVGEKLGSALGWEFRDADDFHPAENVAKMAAGRPLNDDDRKPWLAAIRAHIERTLARGENAVVTCSALKESYREQIVADPTQVKLVYLHGDFALIKNRMEHRPGHFMKPEMLQSQFAALEPPSHALMVDVAKSPAAIVAEIRQALKL